MFTYAMLVAALFFALGLMIGKRLAKPG